MFFGIILICVIKKITSLVCVPPFLHPLYQLNHLFNPLLLALLIFPLQMRWNIPAFKYEASSIFLTQWQFFFVTLTPKVIVLMSGSVLHILMPLYSGL